MSTSTATKPDTEADGDPPKKSKAKLVVVAVVVLALIGGAAYWFLLRGSSAPKAPEPGEVVTLEPIQVNLTGGHYLRVGLALQMTAEAHEADGSKALDSTISLFTGRSVEELADAKERHKLKDELTEELHHSYHDEVMEVYFTEFVTQ